jgi:hypothetical protein
MDFEHFSISRDLFYLASFFTGAAVGCFLAARSSVRRGRDGWISAALCFLSCAVAALSGSIALSMGAVFKAFPLFIPSAAFFTVGVLAFRFPRAGFVFVFFAGVFTVFVGAAFLRYPRLVDNSAGNLVMIVQSVGGGILVRKPQDSAGWAGRTDGAGLPDPANRPSNPADADAAETWNLAEDASSENLYFEAFAVEAHPLFPVFGGERRGFFSGAGRGTESLFSVKTIFFKAPAANSSSSLTEAILETGAPSVPGFSPRYFRVELPIRSLFPGMQFSVVFSGETLEFDPPVLPDNY